MREEENTHIGCSSIYDPNDDKTRPKARVACLDRLKLVVVADRKPQGGEEGEEDIKCCCWRLIQREEEKKKKRIENCLKLDFQFTSTAVRSQCCRMVSVVRGVTF